MSKISRIAIIPARSNSKRIKNKNIKKFFNKPIISYSIIASIKSRLFNKIHVSTDSKRIGKIAKKIGADIDFYRSRKYSRDSVSLVKVLKYVIKEYEKKLIFFDEIWLIHACAPLIDFRDLKRASKKYNKTEKKYPLISVREYDAPVQWALKKTKLNLLKPNDKKMLKMDSKKLKKYYYDSATFTIYTKKNLFKNKLINKYHDYKLSRFNAVDIDEEEDWKLAKLLFQKKNSNKKE